MPCPSCGGVRRDVISPGFFRCTSDIVQTIRGGGYGAPPTGQFGPQTISTYAVCGVEYQEGQPGGGGELCSCGTYAVGQCVECSQPVCGNCSMMKAGVRIHRAHEAERASAASAAQQAAARAEREEQARRDAAVGEARTAERKAQLERIGELLAKLRELGSPGTKSVRTDLNKERGAGGARIKGSKSGWSVRKVKAWEVGENRYQGGDWGSSQGTSWADMGRGEPHSRKVFVTPDGQFAEQLYHKGVRKISTPSDLSGIIERLERLVRHHGGRP